MKFCSASIESQGRLFQLSQQAKTHGNIICLSISDSWHHCSSYLCHLFVSAATSTMASSNTQQQNPQNTLSKAAFPSSTQCCIPKFHTQKQSSRHQLKLVNCLFHVSFEVRWRYLHQLSGVLGGNKIKVLPLQVLTLAPWLTDVLLASTREWN